MTVLIVSHLALWLVVLAMAGIVVSLMRQTGVLLERISPAGLSADDKLALKKGQAVEQMTLTTLSGSKRRIGGALGTRAQLLLFVSPRCDVCKSLLPSMVELSQKSAAKVEITLAVADAAEGQMPQNVSALGQVPAEKIASHFGVSQLPHLVLIREDGRLEASEYVPSKAAFDTVTAPLQPVSTRHKPMKHNKPVGDLV